ncbi:hypothetical protein [Tunicatimonas pelagia]|uniref:hypothetical protein n=1 Tax=Tunicatimonas pelagia TaxID=931531 RepID=UPI0026650695|nr:hypothetical protein [Tunicatimonas pelagia]WKN44001.1 hypothetical protein P0M28_03315 [Tunicatimonas pelagia]
MTAYPHNVNVSGKSPWPWATRKVRIEGDMYLTIARPIGLHWHRRVAKSLSGQVIFSLRKKAPLSPDYLLKETDRPTVAIRPIQMGHWLCKSATDALEVYHLGGSKSIISQNGCQIAIMSIQPGFSLLNDHQVHLRVNKEEYLNLSIAMALLLDDYQLHLSGNIFPQTKVSTLQTG